MSNAAIKEQFPSDVHERLQNREDIVVLDVREPDEWEEGHIPQAKHIPLGVLPERMDELDPDKETIVVCRSGGRSGKACEFLASKGYRVVNMTGGMSKWFGEVETGK
ncbi:rhodanese-like domain-containing protein [Brevibacillus migulae]|uniref:rhodanese-like domain-containing protein n=1 Tax=Brevibacillus migulae TaxID=1644114 RepID=UPI0014316235|nr:rhodanese-like domain-containing protein [Brevibacillus migulae]